MKTILLIFALLVILYFLLSFAIFRTLCFRFDRRKNNPLHKIGQNTDSTLAPYRDRMEAGYRWTRETPHEAVELVSFDGLKLRGNFYENPGARGILVACHGYQSVAARDFGAACEFYFSRGFSLLLIDQRAAGDSEGKYVTMGMKEHHDVADWCCWVQEHYPDLPVLLAGASMGASTVLMASSHLPENVRALLADCGYADAWDEIRYVFRHAHLPLGFTLRGIDLWCRCLAGFSLRQYSAPEALAQNTLPIFFIHGQKDSFVPWTNSLVNMQATAGPTACFFVPEATHGLSFLVDNQGYADALDSFLATYMFPDESAPVQAPAPEAEIL